MRTKKYLDEQLRNGSWAEATFSENSPEFLPHHLRIYIVNDAARRQLGYNMHAGMSV